MKKYIVHPHAFQEYELDSFLNSDPYPDYELVSVVNVGIGQCLCCTIWRLIE